MAFADENELSNFFKDYDKNRNNYKEEFLDALIYDIVNSNKKPIEIVNNVLKGNKLARVYFRADPDYMLAKINGEIGDKEKIIYNQLNLNSAIKLKEKINSNLGWYKNYEKELIKQGFEAEFNIAGDNLITIEIIGVPKEMHGKGYGSIIMNKLINYADNNNVVLQLRPAASSTHSRGKLINFYSKFGFVENKGKFANDNYQYMYRLPKNFLNNIDKNKNVSAFVENILREAKGIN